MTKERLSWIRICVFIGVLSVIGISQVCWAADAKVTKYPAKSVDAVVSFARGGTDLQNS